MSPLRFFGRSKPERHGHARSNNIDVRAVNRAIRTNVWPRLRLLGFEAFTQRAAWRYTTDAIDVVDVQSMGSIADAVGCTSFSYGSCVASFPSFVSMDPWAPAPRRDGPPRPHYWDSLLWFQLEKTLSQPWFAPYARPPKPSVPASFLKHREFAMKIFRRDIHDRRDVWFVLEDGSNLDEVIEDLWLAIETVGIPTLAQCHDPTEVIGLLDAGRLVMTPDSPNGQLLREAAQAAMNRG